MGNARLVCASVSVWQWGAGRVGACTRLHGMEESLKPAVAGSEPSLTFLCN